MQVPTNQRDDERARRPTEPINDDNLATPRNQRMRNQDVCQISVLQQAKVANVPQASVLGQHIQACMCHRRLCVWLKTDAQQKCRIGHNSKANVDKHMNMAIISG